MTRIIPYTFLVAALGIASPCGGGGSTPTAPSTGNNNSGTAITIVEGARTMTTTAYSPNPLTITAGTMVTWTNKDTTSHTATSDTGVVRSGVFGSNGQFSFTFANKGTFAYHCTLHPNMVGSVIVQ